MTMTGGDLDTPLGDLDPVLRALAEKLRAEPALPDGWSEWRPRYWQARARFDTGAVMLFGVCAATEDRAVAAAVERLPETPDYGLAVTEIPRPADRAAASNHTGDDHGDDAG